MSTLNPEGGTQLPGSSGFPRRLRGELSAGCREGRIFASFSWQVTPRCPQRFQQQTKKQTQNFPGGRLPGFSGASGTWDKAVGSALLQAGSLQSIRGNDQCSVEGVVKEDSNVSLQTRLWARVTLQSSGLFEQRESLI